MKLKRLIYELQEVYDECGDVNVYFATDIADDVLEIESVDEDEDEQGNPIILLY